MTFDGILEQAIDMAATIAHARDEIFDTQEETPSIIDQVGLLPVGNEAKKLLNSHQIAVCFAARCCRHTFIPPLLYCTKYIRFSHDRCNCLTVSAGLCPAKGQPAD
jgi:hypothetical protein